MNNILLILSVVLIGLEAFNVAGKEPKVKLGWLGLGLFVLTFVI